MNGAPPLIRVRNATVGWGGHAILRDVSLELAAGDYIGLVGPNGAGKSTLLRALLGLAPPLAGSIQRSPAWRAGYVPQRESVEPLLRFRAEDVVAMAAASSHWAPFSAAARRHALASAALTAVGMAAFAHHVFRDLSGGQRQRVILARALASEPTVLVLDEPTNGLDIGAEREILGLVRRLLAERAMACILVSHDLEVVAQEAENVGLIHDGVLRFGAHEELLSAASLTAIYGPGVRLPHLPEDFADGRTS